MFTKDIKLGSISFDAGKLLKSQMTELGKVVTVKGKDIIFGEQDGDDDEYELEADNRICARTLGVQRYPKWKSIMADGKGLGRLFNNTLQYPCPYDFNGCLFLR